MPKFIDMTGKKFGKWTVLSLAEPIKDKRGYNVHRWNCRCECGVEKCVIGTTLRNGRSSSCGCDVGQRSDTARRLFTTHSESKSRLYKIWAGMRKRCYNKNSSNYSNYGARGITVCAEWNDSYEAFRDWSIENGYADNLSIDRIDVDGNYEPCNCRWVTGDVQANNRRNTVYYTYEGQTKSLAEWARLLGLSYKALHKRIKSGKGFPDSTQA